MVGFNRKLFEVVVYPESYDLGNLEPALNNGQIKDYAWILHDKDEGKPHVHVVLRTTDTRNSDHVAKWFGVKHEAIEKVKGRFADALRYLTHANAPGKYQYPAEQVHSNFDWRKEAEKKTQRELEDAIFTQIVEGKIKEYNYQKYIPHEIYIRQGPKIDRAFKFRKQIMRSKERDMKSVYITGESGVGKTTMAKDIARNKGLQYFVSSGSNDVLDSYQGQECIILDDLRPSCMGLSDLLKLLDPHTASTAKSRYSNQVLECELIIITTTLEIETFFRNVFENEDESSIQLMRRCQMHMKMSKDSIHVRIWDDKKRQYTHPKVLPNFVLERHNHKELTEEDVIDRIQQIGGFADDIVQDIKDRVKERQISLRDFSDDDTKDA